MDATQMINDSILESDEDENEENENKRGRPLAKLCILKNEHITERELPLFLGENVLGRDPSTCTLLLPSPSISKLHATISVSAYRKRGCHNEVDMEALVWDLGSLNGTRKGRLKLTPNVRYALSECDSLVVADIPCQYVSCSADTVSSEDDLKVPVSRDSGLKARLPHASEEKEGGTNIGAVHRATEARVSLPELVDAQKTPVRTSCLSFEKTPIQPEGTLVPDSDSDEERGGVADRRHKAVVSDSDSYKSSPTCSTFLSPTNKIVPESEDESPIMQTVHTKNRPHRHVSFSKEETDVNVGRQQLKEKKAPAIVAGGEEEERAVLGGRECEESDHHALVNKENNVSLGGEDELPVSALPVFNMDSDTDMEGEEEGVAAAVHVTLNTNQQVDHPSNIGPFHMDSDTDVDEDASDKIPQSVPSSDNDTKPVHVIQPEDVIMDSDTDVDEDNDVVSDTASKAMPVSCQSTHTTHSVPSMQTDFHLNSDTDADDDDEEKECVPMNTCSKIDETPTRLDIKLAGPESAPAALRSLHVDNKTDDETIPTPAISEPSAVLPVTESCTTADTHANLDILSDSDPDVKDDSPLVAPFAVTTSPFMPGIAPKAVQSDSDADTDVDESSVPPAGDGVTPGDLCVDSDTDVENEVDCGPVPHQVPSLHRENTPGLLVPPLQNCSTPLHLSEGDVEEMETQAFLSPSSGPFGCSTKALGSCTTIQTDENFVVAETQSFICQTRDCQGGPSEVDIMGPTQAFGLESSGDEKNTPAFGLELSGDEISEQSCRGVSFQPGVSDSSHLQDHVQALAMESTQAFVSEEDTHVCAAISPADRAISENDLNLEATQAYGENEEPARCSAASEGDGKEDFAQEATQAYISEAYCASEDGTDNNEENNSASAGTQPLDSPASSYLVMAETQPMSAFEEEGSLDKQNPVLSALRYKSRPQNETEDRKEHGETVKPWERSLSDSQLVAETQPMSASHEESSDEDCIPGPRKRKAKPLQLEEEQTQPLTGLELSLDETQPMHISVDETLTTSGNEDKDDSIPRLRKRKTKQLEEKAQFLISSEISSVDTQPMVMGKDGESDDEDSIPGPRKRKAKALVFEEEETQPITSSELSAFETQPMITGKDGEGDDMDSIPGPQKGKAKSLKIQEETEPLTNFEDSSSETQPLETKTGLQSQRGKTKPVEAGTSDVTIRGKRRATARLREEEELADCAEPPKRQTRGKSKTLPTMRRRERSRSEEEEDEREQSKQYRNKKSDEEDKHAENVSLIKEQEDERLREREDFTKLRKQERGDEGQQRREEETKKSKEKEEQERMQADKPERPRLECETTERETIEGERKNQEEKQKAERVQKDKEQLEKEDKERLEFEKEDKVKIENEREDQEAKGRLETKRSELEDKLERERKEQTHKARPESETKELEERAENKKQEQKEKAIKEQEENKPTRGRRAPRRTAVLCTTEQEQDSTVSTIDDVPARRTRSRSNSSNSVSSERSASLINTQENKGRGQGRGAKRTSELPSTVIPRSSNRRKTVAAKATEQDSNNISQGVLSRSNSRNSLDSDISSCSLSSLGRVRGGRQSERRRKPEADSIPPINNDHNSTPKSRTRGKKCSEAAGSSNTVPHGAGKEKEDSQQACTTRGRRRSSSHVSEPADDKDPSNQEEKFAKEESLPIKKNVRARGLKAVTSEAVGTPAVSNGNGPEGKRKGRRGVLETNLEEDSSSSSAISKVKEKEKTAGPVEEAKGQRKEETPVQAKRKGRASVAIKNDASDLPTEVEVKDDSGKKKAEALGRRSRGRPSAVQKKEEEEQEEIVQQDARVVESELQNPTSSVSRKRQAPVDSLPLAKTPRASSVSPAASRLSRAACQAYKVLFTGVVDEAGERVLARLGGSMAKGVADMNCLVTDKVRRTVKFLCAVAKGVPIVTTQWLEKSGKAGSFLSPTSFIVKDLEQEKKFNFCLQESLRVASSQPLLQGFEIHVTKSVKPEPVHMKDILICSGATFLPKMPSSHKPQTVVISCEEDWPLCGLALSASLPVVTAEFILTGILQQKVDYQTHSLCAPTSNIQPAGGRGKGRKKT